MDAKGTTFADVEDLRRYNRAVFHGTALERALNVGDNGLGAWGMSTVAGTGPCVALPKIEVLEGTGTTSRQPLRLVRVHLGTRTVDCQCRDISPPGICDLNPDACKALEITPPWSGPVKWVWL